MRLGHGQGSASCAWLCSMGHFSSHRDPTTRLLRSPAAGFGRSPVPAAHGSDCAYGMAETAAMSHSGKYQTSDTSHVATMLTTFIAAAWDGMLSTNIGQQKRSPARARRSPQQRKKRV